MNKNPKMLARLWWLLWLMGKLLLCNVCQPRSLSSASVEKHRILPLVLLCITTINCQSAPGDESDHPLGLFSDTLVSERQEAPKALTLSAAHEAGLDGLGGFFQP